MRVFIAVEFSKKIKEYLYERQQGIRARAQRGNFVARDNFHLTVKFIGEVDVAQVGLLKAAIDSTVVGFSQFQLRIGRECGFFPRGNKKIVWMGIEGELQRLRLLHKKLEAALAAKGFKKDERSYNPHITLGRNVVLDEPFEEIKGLISGNKEMIFLVNKLSLMESRREEGRLVYYPIYGRRIGG